MLVLPPSLTCKIKFGCHVAGYLRLARRKKKRCLGENIGGGMSLCRK